MLPVTRATLVLRTDFTDDAVWARLVEEIVSPTEEGFLAEVDPVSDPAFAGLAEDDLVTALPGRYPESYGHPVLFVADAATMRGPDHPLLVVECRAERAPSFRTTPRTVQSIQNNLSIANMDYADFAESVDPDGVFRGF